MNRRRLCFLLAGAVALLVAAGGCDLNQRDRRPVDLAADGAVTGDAGGDDQGGADDGGAAGGGGEAGMSGGGGALDAAVGDSAAAGTGGEEGGPVDAGRDDCEPDTPDCNTLCGPITDLCTGTVFQCGGCEQGTVCDLDSHTCIEPLITCEELGAECGAIRNSCGDRLDCGTCPTGQECDPDTNTCIDCDESVTCEELGYQCGDAWLGCGPRTELTDCGDCPEGEVCNGSFKTCEPDCDPEPDDSLCAQAAAESGVQCGRISNGCGGLADCGDCPEGEACGIRGVANRCSEQERPLECIAAGRECGTIDSACGGTVYCGDCPEGEVCNPNGKCGQPCLPRSCDTDYADQCGTQLDDGCEGVLNCGCGAGQGCDTSEPGVAGECGDVLDCADHDANGEAGDPCSNGPSSAFPDGVGGRLECDCNRSLVCVDGQQIVSGEQTGTCCQPDACPDPPDRSSVQIPCQVIDSCTGAVRNCCLSSEHCDGGYCQPNLVCEDHPEYLGLGDVWGGENAECSNDPAPDPFYRFTGDTVGLECICDGAPDLYCVDETAHIVSGQNTGTCCQNTAECGTSPFPPGCRAANTCTFDGEPSEYCCPRDTCCALPDGTPDDVNGTICKQEDTCDTLEPPATGEEGSRCSSGRIYDDGCNGTFRCRCDAGLLCVVDGHVVTNQQEGTCCRPNTCGDTDWETDCTVPNGCVDGVFIDCCAADEYCADASSKLCEPILYCDDYGANGDIGDECSIDPSDRFPRGDGTNNACDCLTTGGRLDNLCVLEPSEDWGYCVCVPSDCNDDCRNNGLTDRCGGTLVCTCGPTEQCSDHDGSCYEPRDCFHPDYAAYGAEGDPCSDMASAAFLILPDGNTDPSNLQACPCSTAGGFENNQCVGDSVASAGTCECTPDTCRGRVENGIPDLCGGTIDCAG